MIKSKLQQRLDELCAVSQPVSDAMIDYIERVQLEEIESQQCPDIYPDLVGDAYADAMLADLANS